MADIEIEVNQIIIYGDCKIIAIPGRSCKKCFIHKDTKYVKMSGERMNFFGERTPFTYSNQCGAGYGRTCNFVCSKDDRRDNTDVIFVLVEKLPRLEN